MRSILTTLIAATAFSSPVPAQCPQSEALPAETQIGDSFGAQVAIEGDDVWVSAPNWVDPTTSDALGKLYRMNSAGVVTGSFSPAIDPETRYGDALAVDGDRVVVGAWSSDVPWFNAGRVWIHEWDGVAWSAHSIVPTPAVFNGRFGRSVAIEGDVLAVGAPADGSSSEGSVHIFRETAGAWQLEEVLVSPVTPVATNTFGQAIALDDGRLFVTAPAESVSAQKNGRLYIYEHTGTSWTVIDSVNNPVQTTSATFGVSIAVDGDTVLVGDSQAFGILAIGSVYSFIETTPGDWTIGATLPTYTGSYFGKSVALRGDTALVGAPDDGGFVERPGSVYVFERSAGVWTESHRYQPMTIQDRNNFGWSVAMGEDLWVGGLRQIDPAAEPTGVQLFDPALAEFVEPWIDIGGVLPGSGGIPFLVGHAPLCQGATVRAFGEGMVPDPMVWLVLGLSAANLPFKGGVMVPQPDLILGPFVGTPGGDIELLLPIGFAMPASTTIVMQMWIAEPGSPFAFAATNGISGTSPP